MSEIRLADNLRKAIAGFSDGPLRASFVQMLSVLSYQSERTLLDINNNDDFFDLFGEKLSERQANLLKEDWSKVEFVFQLTADELYGENSFLDTHFDRGRKKSFLFFAVDLVQKKYPRGRLAEMTRVINRLFAMPVIILYRYGEAPGGRFITIAVVHRRPHKRESHMDVLDKVTLIKDVKVDNPHRAHIKILSDLSFQCLTDTQDFDQLHKKWEEVLDTEPLNRQFYQELFAWFERAVSEGTWPLGLEPEQQVIRCVTRILFVWFIREKGLIAEEWFNQEEMKRLLFKFGDSDYYRAVLQNLFFATLNVPIEKRAWYSDTAGKSDLKHVDHWCYKKLIRQVKHFEELMAQTPFINGGLFDCLDYVNSEGKDGKRLDMFGDQYLIYPTDKYLNVPDSIFFDDQGLFPLLNRYKFTVEENTPTEIEVALDPELLGQIFENLLAAYNPETRNTARRETGSYYTPRDVVNYMVDEALITTLSTRLRSASGDLICCQERLRALFDYENTEVQQFTNEEKKQIVQAISNLKILDPAVGSGAFPMAILHKLTLALRHLDPDNSHWMHFQKDSATKSSHDAYGTVDKCTRDQQLLEISKVFERYSGDFGRKLYLIQNSIYGVDIQTIACQIARLRFFISLAIEQESNQRLPNFGIRPLPNLETRFVAADTLLFFKCEKTLTSERMIELQGRLLENREKHFHANKRTEKLQLMQTDTELRSELSEELKILNFPSHTADQLACWDPYDQNDVADWFDPGYMFGVRERFDIVIGNPPYIQLQRDQGRLAHKYKKLNYSTYQRSGDIYQLFFERGVKLLRKGGALAYITSNSWLKANYGKSLRRYLTRAHINPLYLIDMGKDVFDADVDTSILILQKSEARHPHPSKAFPGVDIDRIHDADFPPLKREWGTVRAKRDEIWRILSDLEWGILEKIRSVGIPLGEWKDISIYRGITTGYNEAFLIDKTTRDRLIAEDYRSDEILKPVYRGRDIQRYRATWANRWLITTFPSLGLEINNYPAIKKHLLSYGKERLAQTGKRLEDGRKARKKTTHQWYELQDTCAYHEHFSQEKLFWQALSSEARFAYLDQSEMFCSNSVFVLTGGLCKFLCAVLNSKLIQWLMANTAPTSGMGELQWIKSSTDMIPVPRPSGELNEAIVCLVNRILEALEQNDATKALVLESEADKMIYSLYGLTDAEIDTVEKF